MERVRQWYRTLSIEVYLFFNFALVFSLCCISVSACYSQLPNPLILIPTLILTDYQCCGSRMFIPNPNFSQAWIPDPDFFHPGSRIRIKEFFQYFNPKKLFLSSQKYDSGCSSQIRILIFYPSQIQGPKRHRIPDLDPQHCCQSADLQKPLCSTICLRKEMTRCVPQASMSGRLISSQNITSHTPSYMKS